MRCLLFFRYLKLSHVLTEWRIFCTRYLNKSDKIIQLKNTHITIKHINIIKNESENNFCFYFCVQRNLNSKSVYGLGICRTSKSNQELFEISKKVCNPRDYNNRSKRFSKANLDLYTEESKICYVREQYNYFELCTSLICRTSRSIRMVMKV